MTDFTVSRPHPASASGSSSLPGLNLEDVPLADNVTPEALTILRTAEADCGCRIPAPFDEVAEHAIMLAFAKEATPSASVERLEALCKANNDLARMNGEHRDQWRVRATALADALEPFADCCDQIADDESDDEWAKFRLLVGDYRRARQAVTAPLALPVPSAPQGDEA